MQLSDEQIKRTIVEQLVWDDRVDASRITVEVRQGRARLSGTVPVYQSVGAAEEDARNVPGVHTVENSIVVQAGSPASPVTDEQIKATVESLLTSNSSLSDQEIEVSVRDGFVTLSGSVTSYWKKDLAGRFCSYAGGVRKVDNRLTIVPTRLSSDQAIAEDILAALDRNALVAATMVKVEVDQGVVTLWGQLPSQASVRAATEIAHYTAGVRQINSRLTVSEPLTASP